MAIRERFSDENREHSNVFDIVKETTASSFVWSKQEALLFPL